MKVHEVMTELSKQDPNAEAYYDNRYEAIPITNVESLPLNIPKRKGSARFYPFGSGVKKCKSKGVVIFNQKHKE
jgi:hypothetical protein